MFRAFLSILFALILVGVLAGVGTQVYQAGVAQGIVDAGRFPAGATVPVVGGYQGFDFLGLLFPLLLLFLLFGIIRAAFSHERGWDHHGYRHSRPARCSGAHRATDWPTVIMQCAFLTVIGRFAPAARQRIWLRRVSDQPSGPTKTSGVAPTVGTRQNWG